MRLFYKGILGLVLSGGLAVAAATPSQACACCGTWQVTGVASWDALNIRKGPSVSYSKVGSIPSDSACVIKTGQCTKKWCRVSYAGRKGWVANRYLRYFASP